MLRRHRQLRMQVNQLKDVGVFSLALWLAHWTRANVPLEKLFSWLPLIGEDLGRLLSVGIEPFSQFVWLYLLIIPGAPLILEWQGFYNRPLIARRRETYWMLLKSCTYMTLGVIVVMFVGKMTLARSVIILFGLVSFALEIAYEELVRALAKTKLNSARYRRHFILVGSPDDTTLMRKELRLRPEEGLEAVAELDLNQSSVEALMELMHDHSANGVIINAKNTSLGVIEQALHVCELEGVEAWLVADFFKTNISRPTFDDFRGWPMLVFRCTPELSWQALAKQTLDFTGALLALVVLSPLLLGVALGIKFSSPGPVLFRQRRCGLNGQPFTMYKFRSMVTNAEQLQHELAALNEMAGPVFKLTQDPRITRIGRVLRRYSLDEFPQLINVLKGEMSLVGPRPLPVDEVRRFDDMAHRRRLSVKPGLTCLWQISGRSNVRDFRDWVRLDLEYIDNWSFWLDLKILIRTIPVVLAGTGAK